MSKILYTPKASERCGRDDPSRGPAEGVEQYHNKAGDELNVTTDEREEFEAESGFDLEDDTLNAAEWAGFLQHLGLNKAEPATKPAHTPTPWAYRPSGNIHDQQVIYSEERGADVAVTYHGQADAALIVRAVNTHAELVAEIQAIKEWLTSDIESAEETGRTEIDLGTLHARVDSLIKALAKAKGQP